jgi:FkbM family methyltransferase
MYDEWIEKLNNKYGDDIFFLEIGAMDGIQHDPLHTHIIKNNWSGILVEPVKDMFTRLQINYVNKSKLKFENSAITDKNSKTLIYRIPIEKVNNECPYWADGISTINPESSIISQCDILKNNTVAEEINTITLENLVQKYNISNIDILQIDAEGYDKFIFNEIWNYGFRPKIIRIEIVYMIKEELASILELLTDNSYLVDYDTQDLTAIVKEELN